MSSFANIIKWIKNPDKIYTIVCDENRIVLKMSHRGKTTDYSMQWDNVNRVIAFNSPKYVLWGLGIFFEEKESDGRGLHIYNDMAGWDNLLEQLPKYLAGCQNKKEYINIIDLPYVGDDVPQIIIYDRADPNLIGKSYLSPK